MIANNPKDPNSYLLLPDGTRIEDIDKNISPEMLIGLINFSTKKSKEHSDVLNNVKGSASKIENLGIVNVKDFGAKGDGVTDDTQAIQNAINAVPYGTVKFPDGNYLISATLIVDNSASLDLNKGARIFTKTALTNMIVYNSTVVSRTLYNLTCKPFIKGGTLDANNTAQNIVALSQYLGFLISDVKFFNFLGKGLITRNIGTVSAELIGSHLYFRNNQANLGSIAIYNNGRDNQFNDIIITDVETGAWTNDGVFSKVHHWISLPGLISTATMFDIQDSTASFSQCCADTIRYPFKLALGKFTRIKHCTVLFNTSVYTTALATTYPPVIFSGDVSVMYYTNNNLIMCPFNLTLCQNAYEKCRFVDDYVVPYDNTIVVTNNIKYSAKEQLKSKLSALNNDFNNALEAGNYTVAYGSNYSNFPTGAYDYGSLVVTQSYDLTTQIYVPNFSNTLYFRTGNSSSWGTWSRTGPSYGTTASRPNSSIYNGFNYFDSTVKKPVWIKSAGNKEVDTLTITKAATTAGNITVTLNGVATNIAVTAGQTAIAIATAVRAISVSGWVVGGTSGTAVVTFTNTTTGPRTAPSFTDTGSTGVTATFTATTAGSNSVWVDSDSILPGNIGINTAVTSGATTLAVTLPSPESDATYAVSITPTWNTTYWLTNKSTTGFTINFGTAPASAATLDWSIKR